VARRVWRHRVTGPRTWTSLTPPLIPATVRDLAATGSATSRSLLLLAMDDNGRVPSGRYFRSTDLSHSWQEITEAFRDPVTLALPALAFHAGADPDRVYASTIDRDGPTWYSAYSAASWQRYPRGRSRPSRPAGVVSCSARPGWNCRAMALKWSSRPRRRTPLQACCRPRASLTRAACSSAPATVCGSSRCGRSAGVEVPDSETG
jgi:hypothetical protein